MRFGRLILFLFCCLASLAKSQAQTFFFNTADSVKRVTISNFECLVTPSAINCSNDFFSMAIYKDTLYFIKAGRGLYRTLLSQPNQCEKVMDIEVLNSLTADKEGMLYGAMALNFFKINPHTKTFQQYQIPFQAAGDLVFYKDKLFLAAVPNIIAQINIENPVASEAYLTLNQEGIYGLTSIESGCRNTRVFALTTNGSQTQLVQLDIENRKDLGVKCTIAGTMHDAASSTETGEFKGIHIQHLDKRNICVGSNNPSFIKIQMANVDAPLTYTLNNTISNSTGVFNDLKEGAYHIHVASLDSCTTDTTVNITKGFCSVQFPSAFTPNDDGLNDIFKPLGLTATGNSVLSIYNRWGRKVFETTNFSQGWNGKVNGLPQPPGTYIWTFKYASTNNTSELLRGTIVLMR